MQRFRIYSLSKKIGSCPGACRIIFEIARERKPRRAVKHCNLRVLAFRLRSYDTAPPISEVI
jgi:hypothetical protein